MPQQQCGKALPYRKVGLFTFPGEAEPRPNSQQCDHRKAKGFPQ